MPLSSPSPTADAKKCKKCEKPSQVFGLSFLVYHINMADSMEEDQGHILRTGCSITEGDMFERKAAQWRMKP